MVDTMEDIIEWAQDKPLFTINEAERASEYDREYLQLKLHRLVKRGRLMRVERGKYTVHENPMVYGTYIETPSFFSFWTALRYYNLTTQMPQMLHVISAKNRKDLSQIRFHSSNKIFGYERKRYQDFHIFVANRERLLLDCVSKSTVPVGELWELIESVDSEKMIEYCLKYDSKASTKRVGYLIETLTGKELDELHSLIDHNYTVLDLSKPQEGKKNMRWKIVVNVNVAQITVGKTIPNPY
ncbi:MAG: type IV toxin-antitoxin system AbiEi family antitoxin domain-containing protein [Euryarchaeota archaeon]|nr:type IV toxin-antitoxin system AbiEi family antitoxin domain-containing protein [Euryarchaeota archaeon]